MGMSQLWCRSHSYRAESQRHKIGQCRLQNRIRGWLKLLGDVRDGDGRTSMCWDTAGARSGVRPLPGDVARTGDVFDAVLWLEYRLTMTVCTAPVRR